MPENYYFGGGAGDSVVTPFALGGLVLAIFLILWLPRRHVIVPLLAGCLLLPFGITIVAFGLHLYALRLLLIAGWLRFAIGRDFTFPRFNSIDKWFLLCTLSNAVAFGILWGSLSAVTNRVAFLWNALGGYFLVRVFIRDKKDLVSSIKVLAILLIIIAPAMALEHITGHNAFSILGAPDLSDIRDGAIRAKGPFGHAIIAGTIGAMSMPLFAGLWWQGRQNRLLLGSGILSSAVMAIASASSTPIMTFGAGTLGLCLWSAREHLRVFRWGLALSILSLHLVMKAPVWMLIARTGGAIGGSGEHRAMLIDNFIRHFSEWWLFGTRTNADWGYDMWDVDNAFVGAGVGGGLIAFVAFIAVLAHAYKQVGRARRLVQSSRKDERLVWAMGASLFANTVGFFGIVYFDQSVMIWYMLLAMVSGTAMLHADVTQLSHEVEDKESKFDGTGWGGIAISSRGADCFTHLK
jgi:hypothetical protein